MKSLFDAHWNTRPLVKFDKGLFGGTRYDRMAVVFPSDHDDSLFDQPPVPLRFHHLVEAGYDGLPPVTDKVMIEKRQAVIRAFGDDVRGYRHFADLFNRMHAASVITNRYVFNHSNTDDKISGYALGVKRLQALAHDLHTTMGGAGNTLGELSYHYSNRLPTNRLRSTLEACEAGDFDQVIMELNPRDLTQWGGNSRWAHEKSVKLIGIMGLPSSQVDSRRIVPDASLSDLGIDQGVLVRDAANSMFVDLLRIYGPLAVLYAEAVHLENTEGCLPTINEDGLFEMVDGRPITLDRKPVLWTRKTNPASLRYDRSSAATVLNGIHSGGKSELLENHGAYHLTGLSGFSLPAKSATIPLVKRIFHSFDVPPKPGGGNLEAELYERAVALACCGPGDLILMDEFLQHGSSDATDGLEPEILRDFRETGAAVMVVTHRGGGLSDDEWRFLSPGFHQEGERIVPTYEFSRCRPDQETLQAHAEQLLNDALREEVVQKAPRDNPLSMSGNDNDVLHKWTVELERKFF